MLAHFGCLDTKDVLSETSAATDDDQCSSKLRAASHLYCQRTTAGDPGRTTDLIPEITDSFAASDYKVIVSELFALEKVAEAHQFTHDHSRGTRGTQQRNAF